MLTSAVLVLNRAYFPVHVTTLKRAFRMMYQGVAKAVDHEYQTFSFDTWQALAVAAEHERIGLVGRLIRVPRVVLLNAYDHIPRRGVRFSRRNIMLRDKYRCQYCGRTGKSDLLNLDHVVPRAHGGRTTWENVVTSCQECNLRKGGRTPEQARMLLRRHPYRPTSLPFIAEGMKRFQYSEWRPFLNIVDFSYWNVELEP